MGCCYRCFERGHFAARCREPRRCLLCMRIGHLASLCKWRQTPCHPKHVLGSSRPTPAEDPCASIMRPSSAAASHHRTMANSRRSSMAASRRLSIKPGPSSSRLSTATVFLPTRPPTAGQPPLSGCVAQVDIPSAHPEDIDDILTRGLAARFGVSSSDFRDVDIHSEQHSNVSYFRLLVRCQNVNVIPETIDLTVEDRSFSVPIEIESCEEANPILLGEELAEDLSLASLEAQKGFIWQTGFNSVAAYRGQAFPTVPWQGSPLGGRRRASDWTSRPRISVLRRRTWRPVRGSFSNSNPVGS
uniref:CCHC-type domain-containing protein n=1 Tax=Ananas comosus var. bracteatus TaxID=296719 RepID=A0A6V7QBL9_ANACO|nr:unnamed protein product [Ananas comosus var. bracteatus]